MITVYFFTFKLADQCLWQFVHSFVITIVIIVTFMFVFFTASALGGALMIKQATD
jgi:hypothetical protein